MQQLASYDYVIVGAGSAGCLLAMAAKVLAKYQPEEYRPGMSIQGVPA